MGDRAERYTDDPELIKGLININNELLKVEDSTSETVHGKILAKFISDKAFTKQPAIQKTIENIFNKNEKITTSQLHNIRLNCINNLKHIKYGQLAKSIYSHLSKAGDTLDEYKREKLLTEVNNQLKIFVDDENRLLSSSVDSSIIERIDMSNVDAIDQAVKKFKASEVYGVLKTPYQGMNMMCGSRGGIALGESVNISALSHHGKSKLLMNLADGMIRYNTPSLEIEKIKPGIHLLLFISLENEANKNVVAWYKNIYAEQYGEFPKIVKDTDSMDIAKYVAEYYSKFGYKLIIERRLGTTFGF